MARSGKTDLDPDHVATDLEAETQPRSQGPTGPVPPENRPGHQPETDQDKPDPDAFAARLQGEGREPTPLPLRLAQQGLHVGGQVLQKGVDLTVSGLQSLQRQVSQVRKRT
jgi:hypothetical protein